MADVIRELWSELAATVVVSILVALLYRCLGPVDRLWQNWHLLKLVRQLVIQKYNGWESCEDEIVKQIGRACRVGILRIKGRDLSRTHSYRDALKERIKLHKRTRILLQSPDSEYITEEVAKTFGWSSKESYKEDLIESLERLSREVIDAPDKSSVCRVYGSKPILRLYIFDERLYLSVYTGRKVEEENKKQVPVWCLSRGTSQFGLAFVIDSFFESIWEQNHAYSRKEN